MQKKNNDVKLKSIGEFKIFLKNENMNEKLYTLRMRKIQISYSKTA